MEEKPTLTIDELKKLASFLQKNIGIHLEEDKLNRLKKKIENLLIKNSISNFSHFYHKIRFQNDEKLLQELINAITINETYFWREYEQFDILTNEIMQEIIKNSKTPMPTIRILVLPSSSGEELYSIMLSILELNDVIHKSNIELIGVDIDSNMINQAKKGLYSKRSIDKLPKNIKEKYFTKIGDKYQLDKKLIKYPTFLNANLFDKNLITKLKKFDIIFSRNMLIYFDKEDKQKAFDIFYNLLKQNGYLFLGHADANGIDKTKFLPIKTSFHIYKKI